MRALCSTPCQRMMLPIVAAVGLLAAMPQRLFAQNQPAIKGQAKVALNAGAEAERAKPVLSTSEIIALRDVVYHERRAMVLLERARQYLQEEKLSQAFDALQTLLGDPQELLAPPQDWKRAPSDSFFLENGRLHSVRHEALQIFELLTVEQLSFYEKKYSETANSALQAARESGRSTAYLEVARRCFPTLAGAQATDEAATRLLDRGEAALALPVHGLL